MAAQSEASIEKQAHDSMVALGVYKPEFDPIISIYAGLLYEYSVLHSRYVKSKYKFEEATSAGAKKAPIVTTLESLRKDIIAYGAQLGLTAAGLRKIRDGALEPPRPRSALDQLLNEAN